MGLRIVLDSVADTTAVHYVAQPLRSWRGAATQWRHDADNICIGSLFLQSYLAPIFIYSCIFVIYFLPCTSILTGNATHKAHIHGSRVVFII